MSIKVNAEYSKNEIKKLIKKDMKDKGYDIDVSNINFKVETGNFRRGISSFLEKATIDIGDLDKK